MHKIPILKALRAATIGATGIAVAVVVFAYALQTSLPYRIGPNNYGHYLWAERFSIVAYFAPLLAIVLGLASRQRIPMILAVCCIVFMVVLMPASIHSGPNPTAWCYFNLRKIDNAKEEFRRERNFTNGTVITEDEISPLIEGGFRSLKCFEGGVYTVGPAGTDPYCSVHGKLSQMMGGTPKQAH
jgi:hypothetical protein